MDVIITLKALVRVPFLMVALLPAGRTALTAIPATMPGAYLPASVGEPRRGASDAVGAGMSMVYYWLRVHAARLGAGAGRLTRMARQIWPALTGCRRALVMAALILAGLATGFGPIA